MTKLERLREIAGKGPFGLPELKIITDSLPGLLAACNAYIEAEAELLFVAEGGDFEYCREKARGSWRRW